MLSITPVRERISERFPVASFVVNVPADRYFEVACATDPRLFRGDHKHRRTLSNFATSRFGGLLRAPAGQATYLIPPQQLRRFAGARRLYYALATFRGARNEDPILTLSAERLDRTPSIQLSPDFTGRSLDRGKLGAADARYGAPDVPLSWGGDDLIGPVVAAAQPRLGNPTAAAAAADTAYDDGFDAALWSEDKEDKDDDEDRDGEAYGRPHRHAGEPVGFEDAAELLLCGVEPAGYEDATALPREAVWSHVAYGSPQAAQQQQQQQYQHQPPQPAYGAPSPASLGYTAAQPVYTPPIYTPPPLPPPTPPPPAQMRYGGAAPAQHHERYGSVTGSSYSTAAYGGGGADLDGYEDVPDLVRNLGPRNRPFYGNGAAALPAPVAPPPAAPSPEPTRFTDYTDEVGSAEMLPDVAAVSAPDAVFTPADPRHRLRIIDRVALAESGSERYRKVATDPHAGVLVGHCQLAQRFGALGHLLRVCHRRDRAAYIAAFGEHNAAPAVDDIDLAALPAGNLLAVTNAARDELRMAPVVPPTGGAAIALWQEPWLEVFRAAAAVTAFQEAQREVADRRFYLPYVDVLRWLGINSARGHAMFVDRALQMGGGGAARWVVRTVGPVRGQDDLRRALAHLGHADVRAFQAAPPEGVTIPAVDGVFGTLTHAALAAALRRRGDSPIPLRSEDEMLAALVAEAEREAAASPLWRTAAARLRALREDPALVQLPAEARRSDA